MTISSRPSSACAEVNYPIERPLEDAWTDFLGWRVNYEAAAYALALTIDAPPALWSGPRRLEIEQIAPLRPRTATMTKSESCEEVQRGNPDLLALGQATTRFRCRG